MRVLASIGVAVMAVALAAVGACGGDDEPEFGGAGGTGGVGGAGGGSCACDDGAFCNGEETCAADGSCVPGTPPNVSDNNACTYDLCYEDGDYVQYEPVPVDDGDPCTIDDCDPTSGPYHIPDSSCGGGMP